MRRIGVAGRRRGGGPVVGWLDTKVIDETRDAAKAQGWTALVLDTDGNGYVEPDQSVDPGENKPIAGGFYAIVLRVPYPLASMPRAWTAASTTPMPDGRGAGCGRRAATGRRG